MHEKLNYIQSHIENYELNLFQLYELLELHEKQFLTSDTDIGNKALSDNTTLLKFACFSISCFLDIAISLKGIICCESRWERIFFLRNGFVTIRESTKTYSEYQKEIRDFISGNPEFEQNLKTLNEKLKHFKNEHAFDSIIIPFRNKAGAHYDRDFTTYFEKLTELEKSQAVKTISDFSSFQAAQIDFLGKIIDSIVKK